MTAFGRVARPFAISTTEPDSPAESTRDPASSIPITHRDAGSLELCTPARTRSVLPARRRRGTRAGAAPSDRPCRDGSRWADLAREVLKVATVGLDDAGRIDEWSDGAEAMLGHAAPAMLGTPFLSLVADDRADVLSETLRDAVLGHSLADMEAALRHGSGGTRVVLISADPVTKPKRVSLKLHDITGLRDVTLALGAAEARADAADRRVMAMSRLTATEQAAMTLAHELNQPLAALVNYARAGQRLLETGQPDGARLGRVLDAVLAQATRASQIIAHLRSFVARGEADKRVEALPEVIDEAAALVASEIEQTGVVLSLDLDPAARLVLVDRVQIGQVLQNLMRNAIHAMQESPRRALVVSSRWADGKVEIAVADTGPGIPPAIRAHLFEPMVTSHPDGSGLGLMICRGIVQAHGGTLSWRERPGGGTEFRFAVTAIAEPTA